MSDSSKRTLTDADIDAILDRAWKRITSLVGKGVLRMAAAGALVIIVTLAVLGFSKGK